MDYTVERIKNVIQWRNDQIEYIINKYINEGYTLGKLGEEFGCSYGTIKNLLAKQGIASQGNKHNYPRNENYFKDIDTIEKAYWLGFLYADGCVHSTNNEVSINITDEEHVVKFKTAIGAVNHKITVTNDKRFKNAKTLYQFTIKDKQLHNDLIMHGCVPNKTLLISGFPQISEELIPHFIRGYFDGDGSIHYLEGTNNWRISFLGTKGFLEDLVKELKVDVKVNNSESSGQAYYIQINGRLQLLRILKYLYKDSEESIRLNRKYDKYLQFLQECDY